MFVDLFVCILYVYLRTYYISLYFPAIIDDIKSFQKNRGDTEVKYIERLIQKDTDQDVQIPDIVLSSRKRRSPRNKNTNNGESVSLADIEHADVDNEEEDNGVDVSNNEDVSGNVDVEIISTIRQPRRRLLGSTNSGGVSPNS
jgi:hypothetical protein